MRSWISAGPAAVAALEPALGDVGERRLGVGQQPLLLEDLRRPELRVLVRRA